MVVVEVVVVVIVVVVVVSRHCGLLQRKQDV